MKTTRASLFLLAVCALGGCALPSSPRAIDAPTHACVDRALQNDPDRTVLREAADRFEAGCEAGDAAACSLLGVMRERGLAMHADITRARALFQRACRAGNAIGCRHFQRTSWEMQPLSAADGHPSTALSAAAPGAAH